MLSVELGGPKKDLCPFITTDSHVYIGTGTIAGQNGIGVAPGKLLFSDWSKRTFDAFLLHSLLCFPLFLKSFYVRFLSETRVEVDRL